MFVMKPSMVVLLRCGSGTRWEEWYAPFVREGRPNGSPCGGVPRTTMPFRRLHVSSHRKDHRARRAGEDRGREDRDLGGREIRGRLERLAGDEERHREPDAGDRRCA